MMLNKSNFITLIVFNIGMIVLNAEPVTEKNLKNVETDTIKEIEKDWLQELNKKKEITPNQIQNQIKDQENEKDIKNQKANLLGEAPSFIEIFIRFILILAIFGISFYYVIRYFKKKNYIMNDNLSPIQVLASIPIMSGKFLQIVDVAGQIMILGVSENNINLIQIVENSIIAEKIRLWHEEYKKKQSINQIQIRTIIDKLLGKGFSFWYEEKNKNNKNFFSQLTNQPYSEEHKWNELQELLQIQKDKLKRFTE